MSATQNSELAADDQHLVGPVALSELLAPVVAHLGAELFGLLLTQERVGERLIEVPHDSNLQVQVLEDWCRKMGRVGWGQVQVVRLDLADRRAQLLVTDPFELRDGNLATAEAAAACPLLLGLLARTFSRLFGTAVGVQVDSLTGSPPQLCVGIAPDASNAYGRLMGLLQRRSAEGSYPRTTVQESSEARTRELLRQRTRALREEIVAREDAERAKDEMVAAVSHELRTPLTSLRGFTELMRDRELSPERQRHCVEIIHKESQRLSHMIDEFLDLQAMESGKDNTAMVPEKIEPLLAEAAELYSSRTHRVRIALPDAVPLVMADAHRIQQVLNNLLSNAMKYSPGKELVDVSVEVREDDVVVHVIDYGMGIPADAIPKLFTKFFRVDNKDTRAIGGTGLGLALTRQIVERHGGTIGVESAPGQGTKFSFSLLRA